MIHSNIPKMYAYKLLSEFYLILPVLIPYYKANGLADSQVFIIQAVYTACLLIFEIPSGYLADVIGRRPALIIGAALIPLGLSIYAIGSGFLWFILAECVLACAASLRSGTDIAMIWDSLKESQQTSQFSVLQGRTEMFTRIGTAISSILGGILGLIALRLPFLVNIATGLIMAVIALTLREPAREQARGKNPWKEILMVIRFCLHHSLIRKLMAFWSIMMASGLIGVWSYFLYFQDLRLSIGYYGFLFAIYQLTCGLGAQLSGMLEKLMGRRFLFFLPLLLVLSFSLLGGVRSLWLIPVICLNGFLWNVVGPALFNLVNRDTDSAVRATVISTVNMAGSLAFVVAGPVFGLISDSFSLSTAYFALAALILFTITPIAFSLHRSLKPRTPTL